MTQRTLSQAFGFYSVLTDPVKGYDYMTELLVDYAVPFVQLRMKDAPRGVVLDTALRMRKITEGTATRFIVNDDPHVAREAAADGVHVGQGDMPIGKVRVIVGKDMIIGLSTHNVRQARGACHVGAVAPTARCADTDTRPDYIGVGPVWATPTKKIADPAIGINGMKEMLAIAAPQGIPAVCIGGIDLTNLPQVLEAGAKNFCMVRQLTQSEDPERVLKDIVKIYERYVVIE